MTQPGVSMMIHRLEKHYGVPLIVRRGKAAVKLTAAGEAFYRHAVETIRSAREFEARLQPLRQGSSGVVTLAGRTSLSQYYLPPILLEFARLHPDAQIHLMRIDISTSPETILNDPIEFAVVPLGSGVIGRGLTVERFHREAMVIVAGPEHPLGRRGMASPPELARERFVVPNQDRLSRLQERLRITDDVQFQVTIQANDEAAKYFVRAGLALSLTPEYVVAEELARGDLRQVQVPGASFHFDLALVYRPDHQFTPLAVDLLDIIRRRGSENAIFVEGLDAAERAAFSPAEPQAGGRTKNMKHNEVVMIYEPDGQATGGSESPATEARGL